MEEEIKLNRRNASIALAALEPNDRKVIGFRASFRSLALLGMEEKSNISIRYIYCLSALLTSVVNIRYSDEKLKKLCSLASVRSGKISQTFSRTFGSCCSVGTSHLAGAVGSGKLDPESFSIAIHPQAYSRGYASKSILDEIGAINFRYFWADLEIQKKGTLNQSEMLDLEIWPHNNVPLAVQKGLDNLQIFLSARSICDFWFAWIEGQINGTPLKWQLQREVAECFPVDRIDFYEKQESLIDNIYHSFAEREIIAEACRRISRLTVSPSIGHNSGAAGSGELVQALLEIENEVENKRPDKKSLRRMISGLRYLQARIGRLIVDVANDYAKDALKMALGASFAIIVSKWANINNQLNELIDLLEKLINAI